MPTESSLTFDEQSHIYRINGVEIPSVTQILKNAGIIDSTFYTEESRLRGTAVHLATQYLDEGNLDWSSLDETLIPYVQAYKKFKDESGFSPDLIEERIYRKATHDRPICLDYAGTLDRAGTFVILDHDSDYGIVDIKTGSVPEWAGIQLAAYALGLLPKTPRRFALLLKKNGKYKLQEFKDSSDYTAFYGACHSMLGSRLINEWRERNGKAA